MGCGFLRAMHSWEWDAGGGGGGRIRVKEGAGGRWECIARTGGEGKGAKGKGKEQGGETWQVLRRPAGSVFLGGGRAGRGIPGGWPGSTGTSDGRRIISHELHELCEGWEVGATGGRASGARHPRWVAGQHRHQRRAAAVRGCGGLGGDAAPLQVGGAGRIISTPLCYGMPGQRHAADGRGGIGGGVMPEGGFDFGGQGADGRLAIF